MKGNRFHLAILSGNLSVSVPFYTDVLGLGLGEDGEEGRYQDIDFWGHELTLHESKPRLEFDAEWHDVDMGKVLVPHLGIHLSPEIWREVLFNVKHHGEDYLIDGPFVRYEGKRTEQKTFFVRDPNYNVIEFKTLLKDN